MRGADAATPRPGARPGAPGARVVVYVEPELAELVDGYLANRRTEARALLGALHAGDYAGLWRRGHHLKGAGASYGFAFLSEVGAALEAAARHRDAGAVRRAAALRDYLARLDVRLQQP